MSNSESALIVFSPTGRLSSLVSSNFEPYGYRKRVFKGVEEFILATSAFLDTSVCLVEAIEEQGDEELKILLHDLRRFGISAPIILVSMNSRSWDRDQLVSAGADFTYQMLFEKDPLVNKVLSIAPFNITRKKLNLEALERAHFLDSSELGTLPTDLFIYLPKNDGSGYPNGLSGDNIYVYAKICAFADEFDYLTSVRSGQVTLTVGEALDKISGTGGQPASAIYDPACHGDLVMQIHELGIMAAA